MMRSVAAAGLVFWTSLLAFGQTTFEVASVKPSSPDARGSTFNFTLGGGLIVSNGTLKGIIETAYDVRDFQILGGPGWLDSDRYNIDAKSAFGEQTAGHSPAQIQATRRKLQALLAERFQLKVHRDTRELPIFVMVLGKNGARLTESASEKPRSGIRTECGRMTGTSTTMGNLAWGLSRELGRPVRDQTGLNGRYDFQFEWTPDAGPCPVQEDALAGSTPDGPSIFTAMQQQLGLKLESTKGPVEIIVVEHAEKAEGN